MDAELGSRKEPFDQNTTMKLFFAVPTILLGVISNPAFASQEPPSWPSADELRTIQLAAFNCSRNNSGDSCSSARKIAEPLMDLPSLPGICKDAVWAVLEESRVALSNNFQRRDAIDAAAKQLTTKCSKPAKRTQSKSKLNR